MAELAIDVSVIGTWAGKQIPFQDRRGDECSFALPCGVPVPCLKVWRKDYLCVNV
jgi:hypothetical protein